MSGDKCPVDHSRRSWLPRVSLWAPQQPETPLLCPVPKSAGSGASAGLARPETKDSAPDQPKCPVDPDARANWLSSVSVATKAPAVEAVEVANSTCDSAKLAQEPQYSSTAQLPTEREISSIPRTGASDNWVYPLQKQFFEAMKRKNWSPEEDDMQTVVPLHNQVNELAWRNIMLWERSHAAQAQAECGGLSLTSFKGDSKKLTPRAWFKLAVLGEDPPFDRHDWLISRCGVEVPYVIDFYGKDGAVLVDARPRLDSWEGAKLRVGRAFGWY